MSRIALSSAFLALVLTLPVTAQTAPEKVAPPAATQAAQSEGACPAVAAKAESATPQGGSTDGTAPENSGSTGWTGGTGGSQIGTNPQGAVHTTRSWHAPTARGLDLKGRPEPAPAC